MLRKLHGEPSIGYRQPCKPVLWPKMHLKQCAIQHSKICAQHDAQICEIAAARNKKGNNTYVALKGATALTEKTTINSYDDGNWGTLFLIIVLDLMQLWTVHKSRIAIRLKLSFYLSWRSGCLMFRLEKKKEGFLTVELFRGPPCPP